MMYMNRNEEPVILDLDIGGYIFRHKFMIKGGKYIIKTQKLKIVDMSIADDDIYFTLQDNENIPYERYKKRDYRVKYFNCRATTIGVFTGGVNNDIYLLKPDLALALSEYNKSQDNIISKLLAEIEVHNNMKKQFEETPTLQFENINESDIPGFMNMKSIH